MARKNKSLANAFTQFEESLDNQDMNENTNDQQHSQTEALDENHPRKQEKIQEDETMNHNTESMTKDEIPTRNTTVEPPSVTKTNHQEAALETDSAERHPETSLKTVRDITNTIMSMYDEKSKKKTVEETHTRATFLFRKDLQTRLDNLAEGKRGFKTMFLNKAVEALLDEMEGYN
jgi:hypothetical protein